MNSAVSKPHIQAVTPEFDQWSKRVNFPKTALAPLGFAGEYWKSGRRLYEGFDQLDARLRALGRKTRKSDVAFQLSSHLLSDVLVSRDA